MIRRIPSGRRGGYTLVELLVAMVVTGLVVAMAGRWIVHEARAKALSDQRIDVAEEVSSLREELFQDLHHGRILAFSRDRLAVLRSRDGRPDTVLWSLREGSLFRARAGVEEPRLRLLQEARASWDPEPLPSETPVRDPWWTLDADQNGRIEGPELDRLLDVAVHVAGRYRTVPGMPKEAESLTVRVPAAGL